MAALLPLLVSPCVTSVPHAYSYTPRFAWSVWAGASTCASCVAGTYSSATGASSSATCTSCEAGTYSSAGASTCASCEAGKYYPYTGDVRARVLCVRSRLSFPSLCSVQIYAYLFSHTFILASVYTRANGLSAGESWGQRVRGVHANLRHILDLSACSRNRRCSYRHVRGKLRRGLLSLVRSNVGYFLRR